MKLPMVSPRTLKRPGTTLSLARFVGVALIVLVFWGLLFGLVSTSRAQAAVSYSDPEAAFVKLINDYRVANGAPALLVSDAISLASDRHNSDMAKYKFFDHYTVKSDWFAVNASPWDRMGACGYDYSTSMGENIAAGQDTAQRVFDDWKSSSGHNANMLNPAFKVLGVSLYILQGSPYTRYWTTDFGGYVDPTAHTLAAPSSPTVTSLSPTSGPTSGGTQVTITGINLTGATAVTFGGTPATSITSNTATQIVATAPPGTGTVDVKVTTPVGTSAVVTGDKYTYADLPAAPTALGASALSTSSIRVTWTDNATNELGFFIMEWTGSSWNVLGSVGPNTTTYTVTGLSPNTIHVYIVGSYNSAGENWPAEICYAATNGTAPAKATGLTADVLSSTSIKLTWTDNSANEWGFLLLRWNGTDFENLGTVGANTTTYTDTGLTPDHQYAYFVAAVNNTGGVWSDPVWVTTTP